jgi:AraC-like DNA-binding protein
MSKLNRVENQIKAMIQWIGVHHVGKEIALTSVADKHGVGSSEFAAELQKYFEEINKHKIEIDILQWVLGEIEVARQETPPESGE